MRRYVLSEMLQPMKKNDTLNEKLLKPKKNTVDFLLNYSRNLKVLNGRSTNYLVSKN